jgi:uncharacterized membrane protein
VAVGAVLFAYLLVLAACAYRAGAYGYDDLTLINDFLGNTAFGRGAFFISDAGRSHLTIHFTPTLWLVVPLYRAFDSQFLLIALDAVAVAVTCAFETAIFLRVLDHLCPGDGPLRRWAPFCFLILAGGNMFSKSLLFSGHFEQLYMPFTSLALWMLLRGSGTIPVLLAAIPALGVRQDAGLYLAFQAASMLLLPPGLVQDRARLRRSVVAIATLSALYVVVAVKVIMPLCGAPPNAHVGRFWSQYGQTWQDVFVSAASHPWRTAMAIAFSGWPILISELAFLPLLSFRAFLVATLPGALLFLSSSRDKRLLGYYNSSWLLPGVLVAAGVGLARVAALQDRAPRWAVRTIHSLAIVVPIIFALRPDNVGGAGLLLYRPDPHLPAPALIRDLTAACPSLSSVAADFDSVVFVPNRLQKFTLQNFEKAEAVVYDEHARDLLSGRTGLSGLNLDVEKTGRFRLVAQRGSARAYVASGITCPGTPELAPGPATP